MNVIQFPVKHGPITEREHAVRGVQRAACETFGRPIDSARAERMAALVMQRKRRKMMSDADTVGNGND